ncbi:MAG: diguanylate cyclase domain-containing protein [Leptospirales bacterium]
MSRGRFPPQDERNRLYRVLSDATRILSRQSGPRDIAGKICDALIRETDHIRVACVCQGDLQDGVWQPSHRPGEEASALSGITSGALPPGLLTRIAESFSSLTPVHWNLRSDEWPVSEYQNRLLARGIESCLFLPVFSPQSEKSELLFIGADLPDYFEAVGPDFFLPLSDLGSIALTREEKRPSFLPEKTPSAQRKQKRIKGSALPAVAILETTPEEISQKFRMIYANPAFWDLVGKTRHQSDKALGVFSLYKRLAPDQILKVQESVRKHTPLVIELLPYSKKGSQSPVLLNMVPIHRTPQKETSVLCLLTSIIHQNPSESPMADGTDLFKSVLDAIPNPVFLNDSKGKITDYNDAFSNFMQIGRIQWIGHSSKDLLPKEPVKSYDRDALHTASSKGPFLQEMTLTLPDGTFRNVLMQIAPWGSPDREHGMVGTFIDMTDRTQMERKLRESEEKYRRIIQYAPDGIFIMDPDTLTVLEGNPIFADMIGIHFKEALAGFPVMAFSGLHKEDLRNDLQKLRLDESHVLNVRTVYHRRNGTDIHVSANSTLIPYAGKDAVLVQVRNISREVEKEGINRILNELDQMILKGKSLESLLELVLQEAINLFPFFSLHFCTPYPDGKLEIRRSASESRDFLEAMTPYAAALRWNSPEGEETSFGKALRTLAPQILTLDNSSADPFSSLFRRFGIEATLSIPILHPGNPLPWGVLTVIVKDRSVLTDSVLALLEELSGKIGMAFSRHEEHAQIRLQKAAMEATPTPMFLTDKEGRFEWANPAFLLKSGHTMEEIEGSIPNVFLSPPPPPHGHPDLWTTLLSEGTFSGELVDWKKDGTPYTTDTRITPIRTEEGNITHYITVQNDITEKKRFEETLKHQANYDALTQLPNRAYLRNLLEETLKSARQSGKELALCFLDLDGFKPVNDQYGHEIGDRILLEVANRLLRTVRSGDAVARLGGDEFVLLLNNIGQDTFVQSLLYRLLDTIAQPCRVGDEEIRLTASVGVTFFPRDDSPAEVLLRHADHAMYQAKESGRNQFIFFVPESDNPKYPLLDPLVESALANEEFNLWVQPGVDLNSGQVSFLSGTFFWNHPEKGLTETRNLTNSIQNKRILQEIAYYSIIHALQKTHQLSQSGTPLPIEITLECWHLKDPMFLSRLGEIIDNHGKQVSGEIVFNLSDTALMDRNPEFQNILELCRAMGITICLHDCTTTPSYQLELLRIWPINRIKVCPSLTSRIVDDPGAFALFDSIVNMARVYQQDVAATGIEDIETVIMVQKLGVRYLQGPVISDPIPVESLPAFLSEFHYKNGEQQGTVRSRDFPFLLAYLDHQRAIRRLVEMVQGGRPFPYTMEQAADPWNCRFGQWYYKNGVEQFGSDPVFQETGILHERAHAMTARIYQLHFEHRPKEAEQLIPAIIEVKKQILACLNKLDALTKTAESR